MTDDIAAIHTALKDFVLREFLPGESEDSIDLDTPLITGGILDSIATIQYATFVEESFGVELLDHELNADNIDTLKSMTEIVMAKRVSLLE